MVRDCNWNLESTDSTVDCSICISDGEKSPELQQGQSYRSARQ